MTSTAISCCEGRILSLFEEIVGQAYTKMKGDLFCSFFFFDAVATSYHHDETDAANPGSNFGSQLSEESE